MKISTPRRVILLSVLLALASATSLAQQPTGSISGYVYDATGAVIPGATVVVKSEDINLKRVVLTDAEGYFIVVGLPASKYVIVVQAPAFNEFALDPPVVLNAGQAVKRDVVLEVGGHYRVTIEEVWENVVDYVDSDVSTNIQEREVENLPLNGRNFLELAFLTPGTAPAPNFDPTKANTVLVSSVGGIGRGGSVLVDGTDNNDDVVGGPLVNVSQDSVQEFQVATNRFSAEYGRSGTSVINVVTKRGSNDLHGSFSFFERDKVLQELPATFDRTLDAPPFDRQQYSFTLGGPFITDKLFGFGAVEYRDQDGAVLVGIRDVAAQTIRRGFAEAPLKDLLLNSRVDAILDDENTLTFRYTFEDQDATGQSQLDRALGSESYRQALKNRFHSFVADWSYVMNASTINDLSFSINNFDNSTNPVSTGVQLTFPSLLDGSSFRVPQATKQNRIQIADTFTYVGGNHVLKFGAEFQKIDSSLFLGVFREGRIEFVQDFADFDRNNDGQINDSDLLFAVTLRSQIPDQPLDLPDVDNNYFAFFVQDDWRVTPKFTLNLGLRYELDTNVKNVSGYDNINPLVAGFYQGDRSADYDNLAPRVGFNFAPFDNAEFVIHGGYGIYYDRVVLQLITLERGLDGRALPVAVRAGNALTDPMGVPIFLDENGRFLPFAPTLENPFTGFILPGAGASGINIIDNDLENPMIQQSNLGFEWEFIDDFVVRADLVHNFGTHFIIGRNIGVVDNPVVGGPDRVVNLESSVKFFYDGLLVSFEKRFADKYGFRASYTLSKAFNYSNDDQIPFANGPIDPNNLQLEFGPTPNDQRHRFVLSGTAELPWQIRISPILTLATGVPMDIILPDGSSRIPLIQRNAGGRIFNDASELNAFIQDANANGGINGNPLPLAPPDARFSDSFSALDVRISKTFTFRERFRLEPLVEIFNVFNTTNILGVSNTNYSGFGNVLGTESFGRPLTTAGGVFGSGGPRAVQLGVRFNF
ncbi:MAG: TonB-dependent receptor [Acidobacteriota bacterium]|nr:MAG: TonB-dependent receptor [Acidobacteriota bacterium]